MTRPDAADEVSPDTGTSVVFADAVLPALAAGEYEVEVGQAIAGDIGKVRRHEFEHVQPLRVTGPHFGLGPQDVFSLHPPAGSDADWTGCLPSAVLARRGLPWVIEMSGQRSADASDPGDAGADAAPFPWLAVLLLTPEEIASGDPDAAVSPTGARQTVLADFLDPAPDVRGPAFTPRQVERFRQEHPPDFTVTTIDVPAAVFSRIAPTLADLRLLAHTRAVRDEIRTLVDAQAAGDYAVAVGNRLAAGSASGVYIAHLVSLEGFADALPPARIEDAKRLRLISLTGWTFTSRKVGQGFTDVMQRLDAGPLKMPNALGEAPGTHASTGLPGEPEPWDPAEQIRKALTLGYTAVDYRTRLGERTVAWYRGPLLPVAMKPNPQPPFEDAEAALVYDEETGMFDVSFAVAWQTGRLLALADREIAAELARWVRRSRRALIRALGRDRLARTHPLLAPPQSTEVSASTVGVQIRSLMTDELGPGSWGPSIDLSGLLDQVGRLPGLVAPDELAELLAGPGTPTSALLDAVRARASHPTTSAPSPAPGLSRGTTPPETRTGAAGQRHPAPPSTGVNRFPSELRALAANRDAAAAVLRDEGLPDNVLAWLDQLSRLHEVPFRTLVPDSRALPVESIRFAHLDANWTGALVDGALSVAVVDDPDRVVLDLLRPTVHQALHQRAGNDGMAQVLSGFLLRSTAVADWPGLRVAAYADRQGLRPLTPRRVDRPSPTVLLALFDGKIGRVELSTPAQGSGFGVLFSAKNPDGEVYLRGLGDGFPSGRQIPGPAVTVPFRQDSDTARVVDVSALHTVVLRALAERYAPQPVPPLGPGAFGLQLVAGGEAQVFENLAVSPTDADADADTDADADVQSAAGPEA